ncbi:MAG: DUF5074 domain-containing protein, partial [Duncaniella sp.]|nr:DUF5074 domain-containing protein [Duncaniella sp.]
DGAFNTSGDDTSLAGEWKLTEFEDWVMLSCSEDTTPEYFLYLPAVSEVCAVVPDEMTFSLSDADNFIPVFVQRAAEYDAINYSWYRNTEDDNTLTTSDSNDIVKSIATAASTFGKLTYTGSKAGDLYIHVRVRTGKGASYSFSNTCHFTLLPPEIPIESLAFQKSSVTSPLNTSIENELTIVPDNATYTGITYSSSDTKVATANSAGFRTTKTAGTATITASSTWNSEISASFVVTSELVNPVTDFVINDVEGDVIELNPKQMIGIIAKPVPENADIPDFEVELTGNGTSREDYIATMYKVNYWDENNTRIQFQELSAHRIGECTLTLKSTDGGNVTKTYTVKVVDPDRTPLENGYTDGTLLLNEEWFGHTNGGMNYLTPDGTVMYQVYERENPGMSFGCTSQYATIWADRLIAVSKQSADGGDPLPGGGRVVVADAGTLKRIGSIDDLAFGDETKSADGRAVVGATPEKVYVGTSNGVYIVDLNEIKITGKIKLSDEDSSTGADLYSGQIGDMVHAGKYVFLIKQSTGAFVIDPETDQLVKSFALSSVQGITQTADGNVWLASVAEGRGVFTCIDPETLEIDEEKSITLPEGMAYPVCSWGAWRNTPFVGSSKTNCIWFSTGGGIAGGSSKDKYYQWEVGTPAEEIKVVFDMEAADLVGSNARVKQKTYGTLRFDDRTGELIVMTTEDSASGHYRYNWTHFINPETGEIIRTIALRPYYWFQSFAIFPDKYDAVIDIEDIDTDVSDGETIIDLTDLVTDQDNIDRNIRISLMDKPETMDGEEKDEPVAEVSLAGYELKIVPVSAGTHTFTLAAESNGRTISKSVNIKVSDIVSGISEIGSSSESMRCDGRRVILDGFSGQNFIVYDLTGRRVNSFSVDSDRFIYDFNGHRGVYILCSDSNFSSKVIINK